MYKEMSTGEYISDTIEDEEKLPVGFRTYMITDYEKFSEVFEKIRKNSERLIKDPEFKKWYSKIQIDFDFPLFCHMMSFNNVMRHEYPDIINSRGHANFYTAEAPKKLSEAVSQKKCACTEYAVLAHAYFQKQNIPTRYVCGELVKDDEFDDFEAHSFIAFLNNGKEYIFDPVNPYLYNEGKSVLPHVSEFVGEKDICYLETKSLFKNDENWRYSCGEHGEFLHNLPTRKETFQKRLSKCAEDRKKIPQDDTLKKKISTVQKATILSQQSQH